MSGEHLFNATGSGQDLRGGSFHEPGHFVVGAVPAADLDQPVSGPDIVAIRPGRHVAAEQDVSQQRVGWWELRRQLSSKAPDVGFDVSARVVGHQAHNLPVDAHSTQITRPIEWGGNQSQPDQGRTQCREARPLPPERQTATAAWRPT